MVSAYSKGTVVVTLAILMASCSSESEAPAFDQDTSEPAQVETADVTIWPSSLKPFGEGYPNAGDTCRKVGESAATVDFLDDSATLVGCPTSEGAANLGGKVLATIGGITLVSVPAGDAINGPAPDETAASKPVAAREIPVAKTVAPTRTLIPLVNATCPGGIEVHADTGGPIYINGKEGALKKFSDKYFEAKGGGVTISLSINPDGSPSVSYTGPNRANGICTIK